MKTLPSITVTAVVLMFVLSAFSGTAAAAHDPNDPDHDTAVPDNVVVGDNGLEQAFTATNTVAAATLENAFLKAKKAFQEGRQNIQAIKKGEQDPVDVPTFFDSEDGDDAEDDEELKDGSDPELST